MYAQTQISLNKPKLLLVEGADEVYFFSAYFNHLKIENIQIEKMDGKDNLTTFTDDPKILCVEEFMKCIETQSHLPNKLAKSKLYAWLSTQNPPNLRLGQAASKGLINFEHNSFDKLKEFIRLLGECSPQ